MLSDATKAGESNFSYPRAGVIAMTDRSRLILASVGFAIFWTLFMWLWNRPDTAGTIILAIAGTIAGLLWYFGMAWWMKRSDAQPTS